MLDHQQNDIPQPNGAPPQPYRSAMHHNSMGHKTARSAKPSNPDKVNARMTKKKISRQSYRETRLHMNKVSRSDEEETMGFIPDIPTPMAAPALESTRYLAQQYAAYQSMSLKYADIELSDEMQRRVARETTTIEGNMYDDLISISSEHHDFHEPRRVKKQVTKAYTEKLQHKPNLTHSLSLDHEYQVEPLSSMPKPALFPLTSLTSLSSASISPAPILFPVS